MDKLKLDTVKRKASVAADAVRRATSRFAVLAALVVVFALLARHYYPFFSDDALITLRYSERFATGQGLTWTPGERVEGYTDLLWVLLNAVPAFFGWDALLSARVLCFVGALSAIALVSISPRTLRVSLPRAVAGGGFLATLIPLAVWSVGGLEHGFMAGVIAAALLLLERAMVVPTASARRFLYAGIPLAALVLLRADGAVLVASMVLGVGIAMGRPARAARAAVLTAVIPVVAFLAQLGFRVVYYGDFVPNTARAKVALTAARLAQGVSHVGQGLRPLVVGLALVLIAAVLAGRGWRRRVVVPLVLAVGWLSYQMFVGGDIFPGWRQVLLGIVPLAFVLAAGAERVARSTQLSPLLALGLVPFAILHVNVQMGDSENRRAVSERWEWDGLSVGPLMRRAFGDKQPLLAVDAAGALPFWSQLPSLDLLGLNDRYLVLHPAKTWGVNTIGHDLGDADYYLRRKPDIFAFCNAAGAKEPCFPHSKEMVRRREFRDNYQVVRVQGSTGNRALGHLYIRKDGRVGGSVSEGSISYPGYFLTSREAGSVGFLDDQGQLVTRLSPEQPGILPDVLLSPGVWEVQVEGSGPVDVGFRCDGRTVQVLGRGNSLQVTRPQRVDVLVAPALAESSVTAKRITLTKSNGQASHVCVSGRARMRAEFLGQPLDGAHWLAPPAVVFGNQGLEVDFGALASATTLEIAGDNNDRLRVSFWRGSENLGAVDVPTARRSGIRTRRVRAPERARLQGPLKLVIEPEDGDGNYSVRSVALLQ
jgi:hypothetical protein